jgi:hypothetical protein
LSQSEQAYESSKANRINAIGTTRANVAFTEGCFHAFRNETTRQKWAVNA